MPILAALLGGMLTSLTTFFMQWVTKRVAISLAVIAVGVTITAALWTALSALVSGIALAFPSSPYVALGLYAINASSLKSMIAVALGIELAATVYSWQRWHLRYLING